MKILLFALNSSYSHTNLAVRCIKKRLAEVGFDADVAEFNLKDKRRRVLEALVSADADIYGFSAYIWNVGELFSYACTLRKLRPDAKIVFGGPEVSFDCEEILDANPYIDCIIKGEGEDAFVSLAESVKNGGEIPSVIDGGIFDGFPRQGSVYGKGELSSGMRVVYYESSRGCPYRCAYCLSAMSGRVRAKSVDVTLDELSDFESSDNIKVIKFVDRTFNFDVERAKEIWRALLSDRFTKCYHFEICADLLDEESFDILSAFPKGKVQLEIGVQSTNPETLRRVCRAPETDRLIGCIERLYRMGNMHIHADLIAGLPGDDLASFARSYDALYGKCHMLQLGFLKLLRGSRLRALADGFGCVYSDEPPYEVLATDTMSFSELCMLHCIDDIADRYCTGAFGRSMALIMKECDSPFAVLRNLAEHFRADGLRITELSQPTAFSVLYEYAGGGRELAEALILDFLTSQKMSPPLFGGYALKKCDRGLRRDFMSFADGHGIEYFAPALEEWTGTYEYVIDRRNMRAYRFDSDRFIEV